MKPLLVVLAVAASGCAVHAVQVKTLTIPPQSTPVVVTGQCTGTSTDMLFVHTAKAKLDMYSSSGQSTDAAAPVAK